MRPSFYRTITAEGVANALLKLKVVSKNVQFNENVAGRLNEIVVHPLKKLYKYVKVDN